jgi:hypothetical protein
MASPSFEYEWEALPELEEEISPIRRVYPDALDAMMEHLAHVAAEAESEQEAAEGFLPLIPLIASKLLPLAAKALPSVAKALPKISRVVSRVSPQLTRGVSRITRSLFRNPQTRPLVRAVPSIARRTVTSIARQAATGRPVTPQLAQRTLVQQARSVLTNPAQTAQVLRRSRRLDQHVHRLAGVPTPSAQTCPTCGQAVRRAPSCCAPCRRQRAARAARCQSEAGARESELGGFCLPGVGCAKMTDPDTGATTCTNMGGCSGRCELGPLGMWCCCR